MALEMNPNDPNRGDNAFRRDSLKGTQLGADLCRRAFLHAAQIHA